MDIMPVSVVVFGAMPEAMLMAWAGLLLLGKKPEIKRLILTGILQGICTYFVRRYVDIGPHIIVQIVAFALLMILVLKVNFTTALLATIVSFAIVTLVEGSISILLKVDMVHLLSIGWKRILYLLPHNLLLVWIIYICSKYESSLLTEFGILNKIVK